MSDDTEGGNAWERRKAFEMYKAARLAGDVDAEIQALIRSQDALVNAVISELAKQANPIRLEMRIIRDQHKEDEASQAHVNLLITALEEGVQAEQGKQAARLGMAEAAIITTEIRLTKHIDRG